MIRGITDRAAFRRLHTDGIRARAPDLRVRHVGGDPSRSEVRVAYSVPKRVGNAVTRNRIRRRIRAVVDDLDRRGRAFPAGDTLFLVDRSTCRLSHRELYDQVEHLIDELSTASSGGHR